MKIAHLTSEVCRRSAGLGQAVAEQSKISQGLGFETRVFGIRTTDWDEGDDALWRGAHVQLSDPISWSGSFGYSRDTLRLIERFDPDLVHLHGLWTHASLVALQWHKMTRRSLVSSAHGMLFSESLRYKRWRKTGARWLFQDAVLRKSSMLHATSTNEKKSYETAGFSNHVEVIPLSLDLTTIPPAFRPVPSRRRLLFLGRLHHQKGIDWLLEAWKLVEHGFPDWDLHIVGPTDPDYAEAVKRLKERSHGTRVYFDAPVYGEEKWRTLAGAELLVMPSRSENFGLSAAESLSAGTPVIASQGTPWQGLQETRSGWWIESGALPLSIAMREAMGMPKQKLAEMGANGRAWINSEFSREAVSLKWQTTYELLVR